MAKRKVKKEVSLNEFHAWLEGVEELQAANWTPDARQWKLIRDKINCIVEYEYEDVQPAPATVVPPQQYQRPVQQPAPFIPPPSSALGDVTPDISPAAKAMLEGGKLPSTMVPGSDGRLKTPNIDSSDGKFKSSFD